MNRPTYSITKDFDWDEESINNKLLFEMTAKYGIPYFSNYVNSDMSPSDIRSMCCRLRLDLRELRKRGGGFFGSGDNTGCYDEETEVLTQNRGWIHFRDLTKDDILYTRTDDGLIETHNPVNLFRYKYNGDLIHFNNDRFDMLVTPNHNMAYVNKHNKKQDFIQARDYRYTKHPIPRKAINTNPDVEYFILPETTTTYYVNGQERHRIHKEMTIKMDVFLDFLGWFISEGCTGNDKYAKRHGFPVTIVQKKQQNLQKIRDMLSKMPFKYTETNDGKFIICSRQLWTYLRQNVGHTGYDIKIPRYFLQNCSSRQLNILLDSLMLGDGSVNKLSGQKTYYTVSKELIDNVQELAVLCGYSTGNIRSRRRKTSCFIRGREIKCENMRECFEMSISSVDAYYIKPNKISNVHYDGYVYCCEVPNHTILVRRNGKSTWCGNSIGVVTINMPRIAYNSSNKEEFYAKLSKTMDICARSLDIKRKAITKHFNNGLYPYTKRYLKSFDDHFSTIGLIGMNECCLNACWIKDDIASEIGYAFAQEVLDFMRSKLSDYQEQYGCLFNLEASPGEGTCKRFAMHDKEDFPDIITAGDKTDGAPYYTNSSHLPVGYTDDIFEALDHQDNLQTKYTSGTVFHAFLGEKLPDWKSAMALTRKIANNYRLPYFTFSPTYSICPEHGYITGEHWTCPHCGKQTEVYSRVTGYYRAVQNFNDGKAHEFRDRKEYVISTSKFTPNTEPNISEQPEPVITKKIDRTKPLLVTTETCPNCKLVKQYMEEKQFDCEIIIASENRELIKEIGVSQAPTLVIFNDDSTITQIANASNIRAYLDKIE